MKQINPLTLPDELVARCKADPAFKEDVVKNLQQAIHNAEQIKAFLERDLARVNAECVEVAQPAT